MQVLGRIGGGVFLEIGKLFHFVVVTILVEMLADVESSVIVSRVFEIDHPNFVFGAVINRLAVDQSGRRNM